MSYFGPIMVRHVSTKIGPYGNILGTLCAGWDSANTQTNNVTTLEIIAII